MVRKTARASSARHPEPSALMSAFNKAVSTLQPLSLMSCRVSCRVKALLSLTSVMRLFPGDAREGSAACIHAGTQMLERRGGDTS